MFRELKEAIRELKDAWRELRSYLGQGFFASLFAEIWWMMPWKKRARLLRDAKWKADLDRERAAYSARIDDMIRQLSIDSKLKSWYDALELPYGSGMPEVKASYRRLIRKHHPDLNGPRKQKTAKEKSILITTAYAGLSKHLAGSNNTSISQ